MLIYKNTTAPRIGFRRAHRRRLPAAYRQRDAAAHPGIAGCPGRRYSAPPVIGGAGVHCLPVASRPDRLALLVPIHVDGDLLRLCLRCLSGHRGHPQPLLLLAQLGLEGPAAPQALGSTVLSHLLQPSHPLGDVGVLTPSGPPKPYSPNSYNPAAGPATV